MFFGPGKRKGYSSFKVVERSNKNRKSTVNLPSTLPPEQEKSRDLTVQEEEEEGSYLNLGDGTEDDVPTCSTEYQLRKERSSKNWEALRTTLVKSSLQMEGFVPQICVECDCSKAAESRCRDCSFTAYYCLDCCNRLHQTKHHFHQPEIRKVCFSLIDFNK